MKIKWGALVVDSRNKIGGQVASRNRSGAYMRNKVTPVNPSTTAQIVARTILSSNSQAWRSLTDAQREQWNSAVSDYQKTDIFGDIVRPSGFNLYVRLNSNLANVGASVISTPLSPVGVNVFTSLSLAAAAGAGSLVATVSPETLDADEYVIASATAPQSAGKSFVKSEYRQIEIIQAVVGGSIDLAASYIAKFGSIGAAGQKVFVQFKHVNITTGQTSQPQEAVAVVSA